MKPHFTPAQEREARQILASLVETPNLCPCPWCGGKGWHSRSGGRTGRPAEEIWCRACEGSGLRRTTP
jgi:hypothetical protein